MNLNVAYPLWLPKPCLGFWAVHRARFRNPASGHRPRRSQLTGEAQDMEAKCEEEFTIYIEYLKIV